MATTKLQTGTSLGLFATAAAPKKASKSKKSRLVVTVPGKQNEIKRFYELNKLIDNYTTERDEIKSEFKEIATGKFIELYDQGGRKPENFIFTSGGKERLMFGAMDKYIKVTAEKQEILEDKVPDLVETITSYAFEPGIFEKHKQEIADAITKAIKGIKSMNDYEKANLIVPSTDTHIKKGAIECLGQFKNNKREIFDLIQPVTFFKNAPDNE